MVNIKHIGYEKALKIGNEASYMLNLNKIIPNGLMYNREFATITNDGTLVAVLEYEMNADGAEFFALHEDKKWAQSPWSRSISFQQEIKKYLKDVPPSVPAFGVC